MTTWVRLGMIEENRIVRDKLPVYEDLITTVIPRKVPCFAC